MGTVIGLTLAILGGGLQGAFILPMKYMKKWEWENGWLVFTIVCCLIFPIVFAVVCIPDLSQIYGNTSWTMLNAVFWFGAGWGVGAILFGLGAKFLGMALGIAIITGINCVLGAIFPIFYSKPGTFTGGVLIMLALALIVLIFGVIIVSSAGAMRDKELKSNTGEADKSNVPFIVGLVVCIGAGIFCPMMNFSVFFGNQSITKQVEALGTVAVYNQAYAQLLPSLLGGCLAQIVYCFYLFNKNKSFKNYAISGTGIYWLYGCLMAAFWFFGMVLYAIATSKHLPDVGNVVGWPVFLSATIIVSNILGVLTREWKGVSQKAFLRMYSGIVLLIVAIVLASLSNRYIPLA